ncbi:hypothetical protein BP354E_0118 [Burkholderia pseudomallei 354e]|nr:hypothetical protein BP354A_6298 [Burkholderia pseudomallei 354a]EIF78356.1 hypothetical protein BP354E_0118 [Burkholderia pseudomallei 354e]
MHSGSCGNVTLGEISNLLGEREYTAQGGRRVISEGRYVVDP